jgi:flagellar hook-associated protein 1
MSLTQALGTALSGVQSRQSGLAVVAQNIANVNTEGYSRKLVNFESLSAGDVLSGVRLAEVTRAVAKELTTQLNHETARLEQLDTVQATLDRVEDLFGRPDQEGAIDSLVSSLVESLQSLETDPQSSARRAELLSAAQDLTNNLRNLSRSLQDLRAEADRGIGEGASNVSVQMDAVIRLNQQLAVGTTGDSTATRSLGDLEDQRDRAIAEINKQLNVRRLDRADGTVALYLSSGQLLLEGQVKHDLTHDVTPRLEPNSRYSDGVTTAPFGIFLENDGRQIIDITKILPEGTLRGLVQLRDQILPRLQDRLDSLASTVKEEVNKLHNEGLSKSPTGLLEGRFALAALNTPLPLDPAVTVDAPNIELPDISGAIEVTTINPSTGEADGIVQINFDALPKPVKLQDIVDTLNNLRTDTGLISAVHPPGTSLSSLGISASIDDLGHLRVRTTTPGRGIALNNSPLLTPNAQIAIDLPVTGQTSPLAGAPIAGPGPVFEVTLTDPARQDTLISRARIDLFALSVATGRNPPEVRDLIDALNGLYPATTNSSSVGSQVPANTGGLPGAFGGPGLADAVTKFDAANNRLLITANNPGFALAVTTNNTNLPTPPVVTITPAQISAPESPVTALPKARSGSFNYFFGLNDFFVDATQSAPASSVAGSFGVRDDLLTTPQAISHGKLNLLREGRPPITKFRVNGGDGSINARMASVLERGIMIDGKQWRSTISYAGDIIGETALLAANIKTDQRFQKDLRDNVGAQVNAQIGVNLDEELSTLITLQTAYSASARVVSTVQELFQILENSLQ